MKSHRRFFQRKGLGRTADRRSRTSYETPTARPLVHFSDPQRRRAAARAFVRWSRPVRHEDPPWRPIARLILTFGGAQGRRLARFILMAGVASAAAVFLVHFLGWQATHGSTLGTLRPVSLILGPVIGISVTWLYIRDFEPLDSTLTRRLTVYGVLTTTTTIVAWRLMPWLIWATWDEALRGRSPADISLPDWTDSLGLLLGFLLGVALTWVCARFFRHP